MYDRLKMKGWRHSGVLQRSTVSNLGSRKYSRLEVTYGRVDSKKTGIFQHFKTSKHFISRIRENRDEEKDTFGW